MEKMKRILIPTDGSGCSLRAAEIGISLAKILGGEILSIYAIDTVILEELTRSIGTKDIEKELKEKGERYLNYVTNLAKKEGLKAEAILAKGEPYDR